jgi:hypothetical protein
MVKNEVRGSRFPLLKPHLPRENPCKFSLLALLTKEF